MASQADFIQTVPGGLIESRVGIVTILAIDLTLKNPMTERETEIRGLGNVTLQAEFTFISETGDRSDTTCEMDLVIVATRAVYIGPRVWTACPLQALVRMALSTHADFYALPLVGKDHGPDDESIPILIDVKAAGSMTGFAAGYSRSGDDQSALYGVGGVGVEIPDIIMAVEA